MLLPFHRHHRQAELAVLQVTISAPLKKRLWQNIVQAKIGNQATVLTGVGQNATVLLAMMRLVGSGDPDNTEARAARAYWPKLFSEFVRDDSTDKRNALLNYGYAVVRSAVARALVAAGLLPAFGVNHASVTNAFNLADDLVEPFRPFVDRLVWRLSDQGRDKRGQTCLRERQALASIPTEETRLGGETMTLLVAAERAAESLVRAMECNNAAMLQLPSLES
jgi:CRISPR-associated protein Cas1